MGPESNPADYFQYNVDRDTKLGSIQFVHCNRYNTDRKLSKTRETRVRTNKLKTSLVRIQNSSQDY